MNWGAIGAVGEILGAVGVIATQIAERWPIKIFPFPFDQEPMRIYAYWHPSRDEDPVMRNFMNIVRQVVAETSVN